MPYVRMPRVESGHISCPLRDWLSSWEGEVHSPETGVTAQVWVSMMKPAQSTRAFWRKWLGVGGHWRVSSWRGNEREGSNVRRDWWPGLEFSLDH